MLTRLLLLAALCGCAAATAEQHPVFAIRTDANSSQALFGRCSGADCAVYGLFDDDGLALVRATPARARALDGSAAQLGAPTAAERVVMVKRQVHAATLALGAWSKAVATNPHARVLHQSRDVMVLAVASSQMEPIVRLPLPRNTHLELLRSAAMTKVSAKAERHLATTLKKVRSRRAPDPVIKRVLDDFSASSMKTHLEYYTEGASWKTRNSYSTEYVTACGWLAKEYEKYVGKH